MYKSFKYLVFLVATAIIFSWCKPLFAQDMTVRYYNIGVSSFHDIYVNPNTGNDSNSGANRTAPLRTVAAAWALIPQSTSLTQPYRILLMSGEYPESSMPPSNWFELRNGDASHPVIIQALDGKHSVHIHAFLQFNQCNYIYLLNLDFVTDPGYGGGSNVLHFSSCNHVLLRGCTLNGYDGTTRQPQETLKVNQVQYIYVEDCDISNAFWMGLDYVAVQYGHIQGCRIHDTDNDCLLLKGGSAYIRVEGNEVYNCQQCGLAVGQGTTYGFMVAPWLHYEVYDSKFVNNVVHDIQNAGVAARGAYNVLIAHNMFYKIGLDQIYGAGMILCSPGGRLCQGDIPTCQAYHNAGGWGQTTIGDEVECIPNRNVYIYNNIFYNPPGTRTKDTHFVFFGPQTAPAGTNIPSPVLSDDNLQIKGNIFWNGPVDMPTGIDTDTGCQPSNPTCNETLLRSQNAINTIQPQFVDAAHSNFLLVRGGNVYTAATYALPSFSGNDRQQHPLAPQGNLNNRLLRDVTGRQRQSLAPPGIFDDVQNDFNGDYLPDIVLKNPVYQVNGVWYMNNTLLTGGATFTEPIPSGYQIAGAGDFNRDGYPDLVLENSTTRQVMIRFMHGLSRYADSTLSNILPAGYHIAGVGDFNNDGKQDLLLENLTARLIVVWYLNGALKIGEATLALQPSEGWKVAGLGDFNNDGYVDILFQNTSLRQAGIWYLNGTNYLRGAFLTSYFGSTWSIAGVCDITNDGMPDLMMQDLTNRLCSIWVMRDNVFVNSVGLSSRLGAGWQLVSAP